MLVFDKEAVLNSIKEAGNEDKINQEVIDDLNNFDGCQAVKSDWDALVYDKELYVITGIDGRRTKVCKEFLRERGEA